MSRFTRIQGLSDDRRLPRIAKLRLGVKKTAQSGKEYPSEVSYFVSREEDFRKPVDFKRFRALYGEKPTTLEIMFPVENLEVIFPQAFKKYGGGVLRCTGDGRTYFRVDKETGEKSTGECPGPDACPFAGGDCKGVGNLQFLLPRVSWGGTFQVDTSSKTAILDLNSAFDYFRGMAGRLAFVPLLLCREAKKITYDGKSSIHYPLTLRFPDSKNEIVKLLESAKEMREVFDVFKPTTTLELPGPREIEGDLYPRGTVRAHLEAGGADALPQDEPPDDFADPDPTPDPDPEEPPEDGQGGEVLEVDAQVVEEREVCGWCSKPLGDETFVFQGAELCSIACIENMRDGVGKIGSDEDRAADAAEAEKAKTSPKKKGRRLPAGGPGAAIADEVRKQRLARQGKTEDDDEGGDDGAPIPKTLF